MGYKNDSPMETLTDDWHTYSHVIHIFQYKMQSYLLRKNYNFIIMHIKHTPENKYSGWKKLKKKEHFKNLGNNTRVHYKNFEVVGQRKFYLESYTKKGSDAHFCSILLISNYLQHGHAYIISSFFHSMQHNWMWYIQQVPYKS